MVAAYVVHALSLARTRVHLVWASLDACAIHVHFITAQPSKATQDPTLVLDVTFTAEATAQLEGLEGELKAFRTASEATACIVEVLQQDPRGVYRKQKCSDELYPLCLDVLHIICQFGDALAREDGVADGISEQPRRGTVRVLTIERLSDTAFEAPTTRQIVGTALRSATEAGGGHQ